MNIFKEIEIWVKAFKISFNAVNNQTHFVIRRMAIGDVLWTEPIIRELAITKNSVVYVCGHPEIFENFPYSNVLFVRIKDKEYKRVFRILKTFGQKHLIVVLDDSYERKPQQHLLYSYQETARLEKKEDLPRLYLTKDEESMFINQKPYIILHIEFNPINWNHRNIYGIEWQEIIDYLAAKGYNIYIISKSIPDYKNVIHLNISLRELMSMIKQAKLFIGLDSGPANIAYTFGVPEITFFGSINSNYRRFPDKFNGIVLQASCEFAGCYHRADLDKSCLHVGNDGIPKCCVFSNNELKATIDCFINNGFSSATTL